MELLSRRSTSRGRGAAFHIILASRPLPARVASDTRLRFQVIPAVWFGCLVAEFVVDGQPLSGACLTAPCSIRLRRTEPAGAVSALRVTITGACALRALETVHLAIDPQLRGSIDFLEFTLWIAVRRRLPSWPSVSDRRETSPPAGR